MIQPLDKELLIMTVWPSNAAYWPGRLLGRAYSWQVGFYIFTLGNLIALLSIPLAIAIYFYHVAPVVGMRYTLTNRRLIVHRGLTPTEERWVDLDRFDRIEIVYQPGQRWYDAGDLVFFKEHTETFRLPGVSRPEAFRQVCLKAHYARVGVQAAMARVTA